MAKILITGGSGLLGKAISDLLIKKNHQPAWLSRSGDGSGPVKKYKWDPEKQYIDEKAFENTEYVVHLAGAGIADKRWTRKYKNEILASRVNTSALLNAYITKNGYGIKTLVGGSAIGYYGARQSENVIHENDHAGNDFLAQTCALWEKSYQPFTRIGIRTPIIRTGVVLSNNGGAYQKLSPVFRTGFGAAIADGRQYFPWIHINDIAAMFVFALFNENMNGVYNGVSSELIDNKTFSEKLAQSFNKRLILPNIPSAALHLILGKRALMLTEGLKISNHKIKVAGFDFQYENVENALQELAANKAT
ncbi:MAG TPA: TIGR01777 family oxidoreductase [Bacteroidia bacterium]|nr:TIGR01777 family oxidoreductase [Bacteroidia bacterium]